MIEYNSAPEGVRLIHDEDGVSNALLGEELGHVWHEAEELLEAAANKVARWQFLIPSFPWIAPGWGGVGAQSNERKG